MSYVIHNFYSNLSLITITPKFKRLISSYSFTQFITWIRLRWFIKKHLETDIWFFNWKRKFDYLFSENIFKYFRHDSFFLKTTYTSSYYQSLLLYNLRAFNSFLDNSKVAVAVVKVETDLLFNNYFLPIKIAPFTVNKKFYENIFFMSMFLDINLWPALSAQFKIYLNFFLVDFKLQQFFFFNGFFCNIYNV